MKKKTGKKERKKERKGETFVSKKMFFFSTKGSSQS